MRVLSIIIAAIIFLSSCVTQRGVEKYADKHPERVSKVAWGYMDKNREQAAAYCNTRFPVTTTGTSVEVIVDTAAMNELANQAVAEALAVNDSEWQRILYDSTKSLTSKGEQLRASVERRIATAVKNAVAQCERGKKIVIRDTVEDLTKIVASDIRNAELDASNKILKAKADSLTTVVKELNGERRTWMGNAIGTWVLLAAFIAVLIALKIKKRTMIPVP